ncbi:MAG: hypothetical protein KGQ59_08250, partial [Bdellovibrionales bacterium]|nr:hypothetical protein [Bdellovibrionales bacterium]
MRFFGFSRQAVLALVTLLAGFVASPASHAFGRGLNTPDRCDFSAKPRKYDALVEKFLGGARKPGNPGRPPAMVLDLVDASGKVLQRLHESSPHDPRAVASTQKTITAWVASRSTPLDRSVVYLDEDDWHDSANDGNPAVRKDKSPIRVGETVTVRELLQTMLEQSSNAAASALARAAAGTHRDFVRQMNASVRELLDNENVDTYFQNSSGLTDAQDPLKLGELPTLQHSTADNMARMMAKMMARPTEPG